MAHGCEMRHHAVLEQITLQEVKAIVIYIFIWIYMCICDVFFFSFPYLSFISFTMRYLVATMSSSLLIRNFRSVSQLVFIHSFYSIILYVYMIVFIDDDGGIARGYMNYSSTVVIQNFISWGEITLKVREMSYI